MSTPSTAGTPGAPVPRPDGFINPYNFVRPHPTPEDPDETGEAALFGRATPAPRDRYVGVSGVIRCRITTCAPVFVSDSEGRSPTRPGRGRGEHWRYRFYRDPDGRPAIPGSSIRGAVRSVFEAGTNSCWELVADRRLSRRVGGFEARSLVPGRIVRDEQGWWLELLTGTSRFSAEGPVRRDARDRPGPMYAAWVLRGYTGRWSYDPDRAPSYENRPLIAPASHLVHGRAYWARIAKITHRSGRFDLWAVQAIGEDEAAVAGGDGLVVHGYYFHTNRNIGRKHDERLFFYYDEEEPDLLLDLPLEAADLQHYIDLLSDYRTRYAEDVAADRAVRPPLEPSRFLTEKRPASVGECDGELVYARIEEDSRGDLRVRGLAPVAVPRLLYRRSIVDAFPDDPAITPCSRTNRPGEAPPRLCPACRTFGWVWDGSGRGAERTTRGGVAHRSRVRFGAARFDADALVAAPAGGLVLPILSAPKPTTVRFYLMRKDGRFEPENDETKIDYDSRETVVRGRKFYRASEPATESRAAPTNQNRTLADWLREGATSHLFHIDFENLAPVELGALLWSLQLDPGCVHRVGFAKPLGFGSLRIDIDDVQVHGPGRYDHDAGPASVSLGEAGRAALIARFQQCLARRYRATGFDAMTNVRDLRTLLSAAAPGPGRIRYPTLDPDDVGLESFHWFVVNKNRRHPNAPPHHTRRGLGHWLPPADADQGLPFDPRER